MIFSRPIRPVQPRRCTASAARRDEILLVMVIVTDARLTGPRQVHVRLTCETDPLSRGLVWCAERADASWVRLRARAAKRSVVRANTAPPAPAPAGRRDSLEGGMPGA